MKITVLNEMEETTRANEIEENIESKSAHAPLFQAWVWYSTQKDRENGNVAENPINKLHLIECLKRFKYLFISLKCGSFKGVQPFDMWRTLWRSCGKYQWTILIVSFFYFFPPPPLSHSLSPPLSLSRFLSSKKMALKQYQGSSSHICRSTV